MFWGEAAGSRVRIGVLVCRIRPAGLQNAETAPDRWGWGGKRGMRGPGVRSNGGRGCWRGGIIPEKAAYVPGGKGICACASIALDNPKERSPPGHLHAWGAQRGGRGDARVSSAKQLVGDRPPPRAHHALLQDGQRVLDRRLPPRDRAGGLLRRGPRAGTVPGGGTRGGSRNHPCVGSHPGGGLGGVGGCGDGGGVDGGGPCPRT